MFKNQNDFSNLFTVFLFCLILPLFGFSIISLIIIFVEMYQNYRLSFGYSGLFNFVRLLEPVSGVYILTLTLSGVWVAYRQLKEFSTQTQNSYKALQSSLDQNKISIALSDLNLRTRHFSKYLERYEPYNKNLVTYFVLNFETRIKKYLLEQKRATNARELEEHFKSIFEKVGSFIDKGDIYIQTVGGIYLKELKKAQSADMLYNVFRLLVDITDYKDDIGNHPQDTFNRLYLECIDLKDYEKFEIEAFYYPTVSTKNRDFMRILSSRKLDYVTYIS